MADAAVTVALTTLFELLSQQSSRLSDIEDEVKALQMQLTEMKSLLIDIGNRRHEGRTVANWILEITELASRAENVIEAHAYSKTRERLHSRLFRRHNCSEEISKITREMERIGRRMKECGFLVCNDNSSPDTNIQWSRQTVHIDTGDCFVGKVDDLNLVISLLTGQNDEHPVVVSLWGMGGIGKTTVARKVYNHAEVRRGFDCCAWVCITQQCGIRSVLEEILRQLNHRESDEKISSLSNAQLMQQLLCVQQTKRCFIVLDDIWEMDQWRELKSGLIVEDLTSSRILLTTRKEKVAEVGFPLKLGLLNADDAWELLKKRAHPYLHIPDFASKEKLLHIIGKEMVRKCGYLPLVISILGGILSKRKSVEEWEIVNRKIADYLYGGDDIENGREFDQGLSLSYYDLPYYLKSCFLYMGVYKEDQTVDADDLYRIWIALGMISNKNHGSERSLMDMAKLYLNELASRCLVQVEISSNGALVNKLTSCKLHDVVRELCLKMGEIEGFGLQNLSYQGEQLSSLLHGRQMRRHLTVHVETDVEPPEGRITHCEETRTHLRSLQLLHDRPWNKTKLPRSIIDFRNLKQLRVLIFLRITFAGGKLPRGIGGLIHLKCLRIKKCEFDELPRSIGNLIYLQTLDLERSWNVVMPNVFDKLLQLKHLILPSYQVHRIRNRCRLRLDKGLNELETLEGFHSSIHDLECVTRLKSLRRFSASVYDNESLSAIINAMRTKWESLEECEVKVKRGCDLASTEQGMMMLKMLLACPKLKMLGLAVPIRSKMNDLERETIIGAKLITLKLWLTEVETADTMEILGKLPLLKNLNLLEGSFVGEEMTFRASCFPRLKNLGMLDLHNLREWHVEEGAMPLLSEIEIDHCPNLNMIPDGFRFISTLEKVIIRRNPELSRRVLEMKEDGSGEGEDFHKLRHVPSIITYL